MVPVPAKKPAAVIIPSKKHDKHEHAEEKVMVSTAREEEFPYSPNLPTFLSSLYPLSVYRSATRFLYHTDYHFIASLSYFTTYSHILLLNQLLPHTPSLLPYFLTHPPPSLLHIPYLPPLSLMHPPFLFPASHTLPPSSLPPSSLTSSSNRVEDIMRKETSEHRLREKRTSWPNHFTPT